MSFLKDLTTTRPSKSYYFDGLKKNLTHAGFFSKLHSKQLASIHSLKWRRYRHDWAAVQASELSFHIWNANWPMKSEAKMAAHGGQFWMSVSVPYAGLYVNFSLSRDFSHFLTSFLWKYTQKFLQNIEISLRILNIFRQGQTELQVIYFRENKLSNIRET